MFIHAIWPNRTLQKLQWDPLQLHTCCFSVGFAQFNRPPLGDRARLRDCIFTWAFSCFLTSIFESGIYWTTWLFTERAKMDILGILSNLIQDRVRKSTVQIRVAGCMVRTKTVRCTMTTWSSVLVQLILAGFETPSIDGECDFPFMAESGVRRIALSTEFCLRCSTSTLIRPGHYSCHSSRTHID